MITPVGLQDQLLNIVVAKEKPELAEEKARLVGEVGDNFHQVRGCDWVETSIAKFQCPITIYVFAPKVHFHYCTILDFPVPLSPVVRNAQTRNHWCTLFAPIPLN